MASSTTAPDRRWGSSRRGGMTVLGKVAVPKPINLPSQRLENHGLDPNVEIVPKGTLSWGSRPSSSGSNAWGPSVLSPRTESGGGSPCHLSGRPSSGGGSRPSTASSEKTQESSINIWTSNSRPSSASGALASNNISLTALRPRSAESRPGSSQLSRFAEPISEGSGAWGANNTADKLRFGGHAGNNFSLTSGDFPTLGSEKNSGKNVEVLDKSHVRPGSSSGRPHSSAGKIDTTSTDVISESIDSKGGMENLRTKDSPEHMDDGPRPSMDTWHGDTYPYPNTNVPLQHHSYEIWRGPPPANPPSGVWYRPHPGAPHPPYRGAHHPPPGGYPMEPFSYYRPQVPGPGLPNSHSAPRVAGPPGPPSTNGELCRPMMEPYMHPAMPMRPSFYPGYYGPPMGYSGPNERDFPYAGMPPGPAPAYNRYAKDNRPELSDSRFGKGEVEGTEESGPVYDFRRQYGAPVKQNVGWEKNDQQQHAGGRVMPNVYTVRDKPHSMRMPIRENAQPKDGGKEEIINFGSQPLPCEAADVLYKRKDGSDNHPAKIQGTMGDLSSANLVADSVSMKDQSLIQKIEGLNAKARASDLRPELYDRMQTVNVLPNHSLGGASVMVHLEKHHPSGVLVPVSGDMNASAKGKISDASVSTVTTVSRTSGRVVQGRGEYYGKGGVSSQEPEGWKKRSAVLETPNVSQSANPEGSRADSEIKDDGVLSIHEPSDIQRAKMREIAKQRAAELQKEEEQRIREQKAKALAKLEELNRRSINLNKEANSQKLETVTSQVSDQAKLEKPVAPAELNTSYRKSEGTSSTLVFGSIVSLDMRTSEPSSSASGFMSPSQHKTSQNSVSLPSCPSPAAKDTSIDVDSSHPTVPQVRGQKRMGYKLKESGVLPEKGLIDKQIVTNLKENKGTGSSEAFKEVMLENVSAASANLNPSVESGSGVESSVHARKRGNKGAKNKQKMDGKVSRELDHPKSSTDTTKPSASEWEFEPDISLTTSSLDKNAKVYMEKHTSSLPQDGAHGKASLSKFQHQRKVSRNSQGRPVDKSQGNDPAVWAPVKPLNNAETTRQNDQKASESATTIPTSNNLAMRAIPKTKRAEMERYIPKPVAKELAQQAIVQLPSPAPVKQSDAQPSSTSTLEQNISKTASSSSGKNTALQPTDGTRTPVEPHHGEAGGKVQQIKAHGSWRQRGSVEPIPVLSAEDRSSSNVYPGKDSTNTQSQPTDEGSSKGYELPGQGKIPKPDEQPVKGHKCKSNESQTVDDGWGDGWNIIEEPPVSSVGNTFNGQKGHYGAVRGKKHQFKGQRGGQRQNFDQKNPSVSDLDAQQAPHPETGLSDNRPTSSKGNRVAHWQRKSEVHLGHEQQGNRNPSRGWQTMTDEGERIARTDASRNYDPEPPSHGSQDSCADSAVTHRGLFKHGDKEYSGAQNMQRTRKNVPVRGRLDSTNEEPRTETDSGGLADDVNSNEQPSSAFGKFRKNGNYNNNRFNKRHDFQGDQNFIAEDSKQNYVAGNRDRQRYNSMHYEYQPVRGQNSSSNSEGQSGNRNMTQRFRERQTVGPSRNGGSRGGSNNVQADGNC